MRRKRAHLAAWVVLPGCIALLIWIAMFARVPGHPVDAQTTFLPGRVVFTDGTRSTEPNNTAVVNLTPTPISTPTPTVGTAAPDLTIGWMSVQLETGGSCAFTSTALGISVSVENIGTGDAGSFVVEVNGERQIVTAGLAAGESIRLWFGGFVAFDNNVAVVDVTNLVAERNEENNRREERLPIPTLPATCTPTPSIMLTPSITPTPTGEVAGDARVFLPFIQK